MHHPPSLYRHNSQNHPSHSKIERPTICSISPDDFKLPTGKKTCRAEGDITMLNTIEHENNIFSGNSHKHATALGFSDGSIDINSIKDGQQVHTLYHERDEDPKLPVTSINFLPYSKDCHLLLASYASGFTTLWNYKAKKILWNVKEESQTLVNSLNSEITKFAIGNSDGKISLYDLERQSLISTFERGREEDILDGHVMRVFALKFHPTSTCEMVSGGWDNTVQIWDTRQQQSVRKISGPHVCGNGIDFMSSGNHLLTASWTKYNPIQIWDYKSCSHLEDINLGDPISYPYTCRYSEEGNFILVAGGNNNFVRIFDLSRKITVASLKDLPDAVFYAQEFPHRPNYHLETKFKVYIAYGVYSSILNVEL